MAPAQFVFLDPSRSLRMARSIARLCPLRLTKVFRPPGNSRPANGNRESARGHLGQIVEGGANRDPRRFLRLGRALADGDEGGVADRGNVRSESAARGVTEAPTIAELAKKLHKEDTNQNKEMEKDEEEGKNTHKTPSWSSLVPIRASGSKKPLFLVHGAEGNILLYREVTQHLGPDQPVYGLQSQGLNGDGRFLTTVEEMASHYLKEILEAQPHGPYFLGGYCLGGTIAYEMAQQLTALGEKVEVVFMLDTCNFASVSPSKVSWLEPLHFLQNLWFHAANIFSLGAKDRKKFLRQKVDVESSRIGIRLRAAYHALANLGSAGKRKQLSPFDRREGQSRRDASV